MDKKGQATIMITVLAILFFIVIVGYVVLGLGIWGVLSKYPELLAGIAGVVVALFIIKFVRK